MKLRDTVERLVWTVVAAVAGGLVGAPILGVDTWKGAAFAGFTAAANYLLLVARVRLTVLPDPGDGLPGMTG